MAKRGDTNSFTPSPRPSPPPQRIEDHNLSEDAALRIARIACRMFQLDLAPTAAAEAGFRYDEDQLLPVIMDFMLNDGEIPVISSNVISGSSQCHAFFRIMAQKLGFSRVEIEVWLKHYWWTVEVFKECDLGSGLSIVEVEIVE
ncbi:hypothetical protein N7G274_003163 [Stereocaulon virgatum]|uniref:Uncharacterized protein n=1 Tax=Stereocaulon virgatum TaxID=373712 RepID=A0ABR4AFB2_9LECA